MVIPCNSHSLYSQRSSKGLLPREEACRAAGSSQGLRLLNPPEQTVQEGDWEDQSPHLTTAERSPSLLLLSLSSLSSLSSSSVFLALLSLCFPPSDPLHCPLVESLTA